jgi:hypothetical protein
LPGRTDAIKSHKNETDPYGLPNQTTKHTACICGCGVRESHVKPGARRRPSFERTENGDEKKKHEQGTPPVAGALEQRNEKSNAESLSRC